MELKQLEETLNADGFSARGGKFQVFAEGEASLVGFIDPWLGIYNKTPAYFGYGKFSSDLNLNRDLFRRLHDWSLENDTQEIWGPINYSTYGEYRYRTSHLDSVAFMGEPDNGIHELRVLEENGFQVGQRYLTYEIHNLEAVNSWADKNGLTQAMRSLVGYRIVRAEELNLNHRMEELHRVTQEIFADNFAFKPIQFSLFKNIFSRLVRDMCQKTSVFLLDKQSRICGYFINFPDGRDPERLLVKTAGVVPSARLMGLSFLALLGHVLMSGATFKKASLCLMREGNFPSLISRSLFNSQREYALFKKTISPPP